jgi:hypothetical protein
MKGIGIYNVTNSSDVFAHFSHMKLNVAVGDVIGMKFVDEITGRCDSTRRE